jgi:hypothetical protein
MTAQGTERGWLKGAGRAASAPWVAGDGQKRLPNGLKIPDSVFCCSTRFLHDTNWLCGEQMRSDN